MKTEKQYELDYYKLLSTGMFWEFYPDLNGIWEDDEHKFIENERLLDATTRKDWINKSTESHHNPLKLS